MYHCLNKEELSVLLDYAINGNGSAEDYLFQLIKAAQNWSYDLGELNYSMAMILEHKRKHNIECEDDIIILYNLSNQMSLEIHEMDKILADHMIHNLPIKSLSLEENLIDLQTNIAQYNYAKSLRY